MSPWQRAARAVTVSFSFRRTPVRQGKDWIVPFVLRDHGNGNSYAVRARVSDAGGSPRVVAVENLRQLFVILGKEAQALES